MYKQQISPLSFLLVPAVCMQCWWKLETQIHNTTTLLITNLQFLFFQNTMTNNYLYQVRRNTILYRACSMSINVPATTTKKGKRLLTDHLLHLVLTWAYSGGSYNPQCAFKQQEQQVFQFLLHEPIPSSMINPVLLVRLNLLHIFSIRRFVDSSGVRQLRKAQRNKAIGHEKIINITIIGTK
jgi:hypothetical protein